jgi:hypothetical protein
MDRAADVVKAELAFRDFRAIIVLDPTGHLLLGKQKNAISMTISIILSFIFILDSLPSGLHLDLNSYRSQTQELKSWIKGVEFQTGGHCPVLEIPVTKYPEVPPTLQLADYEEFLPYLESSNLSFTYGSMKMSRLSAWQDKIPGKIDSNFLKEVSSNGFCSVVWDSLGLSAPDLANLEGLAKSLGLSVIRSTSNRWGSIGIQPLREKLSVLQQENYRQALLGAIELTPEGGLSSVEQDAGGKFSWAISNTVKYLVLNPGSTQIDFPISFTLSSSPNGQSRRIKVTWGNQRKIVDVDSMHSAVISLQLALKPRSHTELKIETDSGPDTVSGDPRHFYFRLSNTPHSSEGAGLL